jgi:hypothetical protein
MKAEIKDDNLVITIPLNKSPNPSKSGKTLVVATTGGFMATTATVQDKPVKVSLNAIIDR